MPFEVYPEFGDEIEALLKKLDTAINDTRRLVERNRIFYDRCYKVGAISPSDAIKYGFTGPCLRAAGVEYDLRKAEPITCTISLISPYVWERMAIPTTFLCQNYEMIESTKIIRQALAKLKPSRPLQHRKARLSRSKRVKKLARLRRVYDCTERQMGSLVLHRF